METSNMAGISKASTETTDGRKRRTKRGSLKLSTMTIDQYIAAVEEWQKRGEELRAEGRRFQTALNNVGFNVRIPMNPNQIVPQQIQQPMSDPVSVTNSSMIGDPALSKDMGSTSVSPIDLQAQQANLQEDISNQLRQANMLLQRRSNSSSGSNDPF